MDYNLIVRPLVGAVIGYSTNWLAIKMLFRPREEKYIGKIKIPFTPGVIPRERDRIAKSLGEAVGERLLTPEVITNELLNDQVTDHIKSYVIQELLKEDLSLEQLLKVVLKDQAPQAIRDLNKTITSDIGMYINTPDVKNAIRQKVSDYLSSSVPYNTLIGTLLNDRLTDEITGVVRNNAEGISDYLYGLANTENVKVKISSAIETLVMEKVGALGAMFLDGPSMAESVVHYIENLLKEEDVQEGIVGAVNDGIKKIQSKNLSETVSIGLYQEVISGVTEKVMQGLYSQVNEQVLMAAVEPMMSRVLSKKVHLTEDKKAMIENQVESLYRHFVENNVGTFLETFQVSKIVESEIKQFSVMDIEQLIFAIVDKELNAITWIGGLLGFIIGLVYVVI